MSSLAPPPSPSPGGRTGPSRARWADALRLVLVWTLLCAAVVAWGRVLTGPLSGSLGAAENDVSGWVAERRTPTWDLLASLGTLLGDTVLGIVLVTLLVVGFGTWQRSFRPAVAGLVGYTGLLGVYLVATAVDPRDRPPVRILDPGLVPDHSYPSGHVLTAMTVVGTLLLLVRRYGRLGAGWALVAALVPVLTAWSRVYQGAHHVSDVLTSVVVAAVWLSVVGATLLQPDARGGVRTAPAALSAARPRRSRPR